MKGDAVKLATASAQIQTVAAALGTIDVGRKHLAILENAIGVVPLAGAVQNPIAQGFAWLTGQTTDTLSQLRDEILQAQNDFDRHASHFNGYGADDQDEEISTAHSMGIAASLQFVNKIFNHTVDALTNPPSLQFVDFVQAVIDVLAAVAEAAVKVVDSAAKAAANVAASLLSAFWLPLAIAGGGVLIYFAWQKGLLRKVVP